jgi:hypothetical protein
LRIFISSPGDVPVERDRAADVVERLRDEFVHYAVLEPFFCEDQPARATDTFQSQFPEASGMDIVVGILWARIGTRLPLDEARPDGRRYESGTVYELETAAASYQSRGAPDLVVYRRMSDPVPGTRYLTPVNNYVWCPRNPMMGCAKIERLTNVKVISAVQR